MSRNLHSEAAELNFQTILPKGQTDPTKPPVIFLHGLMLSLNSWGNIPTEVSDKTGRRAYILDARNHGLSQRRDNYRFHQNVADLFDFMSRLNIGRVALVGHGMGAHTAIEATFVDPNRIERLFVFDMPVGKLSDSLIEKTSSIVRLWAIAVERLPKDTPFEDVTPRSVKILRDELDESMKNIPEIQSYMDSGTFYNQRKCGRWEVGYNKVELLKALRFWEADSYPYRVESPVVHFFSGENSFYNIRSKEQADPLGNFANSKFTILRGATHNMVTEIPRRITHEIVQGLEHERLMNELKGFPEGYIASMF